MAFSTRPRASLGSAEPATSGAVALGFVVGWLLLAGGEVFGPPGAPAVALGAAIATGVRFGPEAGGWAGLLLGLAADLLSSAPIGAQAGLAAVVGALVGRLSSTLSPSSLVAPALLTVALGWPYRVGVGLLVSLGGGVATSVGPVAVLWLAPWDLAATLFVWGAFTAWVAWR